MIRNIESVYKENPYKIKENREKTIDVAGNAC